jgi:ArsR family transcriptional regulator, arsenate/arsenite/antimonite-responsive transcriptional repressor
MYGISVPLAEIEVLTKQLKVLANPKRMQIFHLLMEGVHCNCELGEALDMAPNLISHHLGILRDAGLVDVERDVLDARWIYFSINVPALEALNVAYASFFDLDRIKPRRPNCGPQGQLFPISKVAFAEG